MTLTELVKELQKVVLAASDIGERHELDSMLNSELWVRVKDHLGRPMVDTSTGDPVYRPRMMHLMVPQWDPNTQQQVEQKIQVPWQSLCTGQSLKLDELEIEMDIEIQGMVCDHDGKATDLKVNPGVGNRLLKDSQNSARIRLKFSGQEPPEGYARVDNHLIKILP